MPCSHHSLRPLVNLLTALLLWFTFVTVPLVFAEPPSPENIISKDLYLAALIENLTHSSERTREAAIREIGRINGRKAIPALIDILALNDSTSNLIVETLKNLSGTNKDDDWRSWASWSKSYDIQPHDKYAEFKRELLEQLDPAFKAYALTPENMNVPLSQLFWSGQSKDATPALNNPLMLERRKAVSLENDEAIYGIYYGGEARAYPARIVDWHLIVNDVAGNKPICLIACPYSGSISAFRTDSEETTYVFGYSGLIYQNSLVLYERQNNQLWSGFTGSALTQGRAKSASQLEQIPLTQTTWAEWKSRFPDTLVLDRNTGYKRPYEDPSPYFMQFTSEKDWFPVDVIQKTQEGQDDRAMIYGVRLNNTPKAYPMDELSEKKVVNDTLSGVNLVLITDRESGSIRVYLRDQHLFSTYKKFEIKDQDSHLWHVVENELQKEGSDEHLRRIPGQRAFLTTWFTWYPESEFADGA